MSIRVHHINCGSLTAPNFGYVPCRGLLLVKGRNLALVDAGIGLLDVRDPEGRIGRELIDMAGFQFDEQDTAVRRIEALGYDPADVRDIFLTHGDPDHTGGLADFPNARIHVSREELASIAAGWWRYRSCHFTHKPSWRPHETSSGQWFGLEARRLPFGGEGEVLLIPLFGHTKGHCGVAIRQGDRWLLHVGDAYYLHAELETDEHPVSILAAQRADDDSLRRRSIEELRRIRRDHGGEVLMCSYHDSSPPA